MSQTLQSVLCITTNKYLVHVLVVLLHARFSVVCPIPFLLAAIFFPVHPYIGSTTVLPDYYYMYYYLIFFPECENPKAENKKAASLPEVSNKSSKKTG